MIFLAATLSPALAATPWSIDTPLALAAPGSSPDTAVVVGMEQYQDPRIPVVPFAKRDADVFVGYLVATRGLDPARIHRLDAATRDELLPALASARDAAKKRGGRVWVYFAGHGWRAIEERADRATTVQQVLVLHDAPATLDGFVDRGVREQEVWSTLRGVPAEVVVDACFEGGARNGALVDPGARYVSIDYDAAPPPEGVSTWRAVAPGQVALPFREAEHGVFTFLWLAGARGWADGTPEAPGAPTARDGRVTAAEVHAWMERVAGGDAVQTPTWAGDGTVELARGTPARPLEGGPTVEELRQWMPFLARGPSEVGADLGRWLTWQEELERWFGLQEQDLQARATTEWGRVRRLLDAASPVGPAAVERFIEQYRGASLERDGVFGFVPVPELEDAWVALGKPADTGLDGYGDEMTLIPGGWYRVGLPPTENGLSDEAAQELVKVNSFELGRFEVSQELFAQYQRDGFAKEHEGVSLLGDSLPAQNLDWCSAMGFANWMTDRWNDAHPGEPRTRAYVGVEQCAISPNAIRRVPGTTGFRLPSELEWEHAARAGSQRAWRVDGLRYQNTDDLAMVCRYGNVWDKTSRTKFGDRRSPEWFRCSDLAPALAPIGIYRANAWGLYDMFGNVAEWMENGPLGYAVLDCCGIWAGIGEYPCLRGGSWRDGPGSTRVAQRNWEGHDFHDDFLGLRLARSLP